MSTGRTLPSRPGIARRGPGRAAQHGQIGQGCQLVACVDIQPASDSDSRIGSLRHPLGTRNAQDGALRPTRRPDLHARGLALRRVSRQRRPPCDAECSGQAGRPGPRRPSGGRNVRPRSAGVHRHRHGFPRRRTRGAHRRGDGGDPLNTRPGKQRRQRRPHPFRGSHPCTDDREALRFVPPCRRAVARRRAFAIREAHQRDSPRHGGPTSPGPHLGGRRNRSAIVDRRRRRRVPRHACRPRRRLSDPSLGASGRHRFRAPRRSGLGTAQRLYQPARCGRDDPAGASPPEGTGLGRRSALGAACTTRPARCATSVCRSSP